MATADPSLYILKKKLILTPERRAALTKPNSRYVICWVPDHPDDEGRTECRAGFFSLFIRVLYGIRLAIEYRVPYYIDYGSMRYSYSDPKRFAGDANFWNYYFVQSKLFPSDSLVANRPYETFPLRIWSLTFRREMHTIVRDHIELQPNVEKLIDEKKEFFRKKRILGVHIRRTDHPGEVEPVALSIYKESIHRVLRDYDYVFIATDDMATLEAMIHEFGSQVMYNEVKRSVDGAPVHRLHSTENRYELGLDALLDCYCLSFCQKVILCHSNLSYAALLLNPTLEYTLLETPKHRMMRLKTSLTYYLDQIGVRLPKG